MYLKRLIIKGFKTFADKAVLEFDPSGITAIVGPNGCGKSNIVDGLRFALGESTLRELRVQALPEVIFAGASNRKSLSLAESALIFDNTRHVLPVDYSEVMVRRRTFRDGESEFIINGQTARLKDIRNLFLDTGLSGETLCIIGQGKVDSILSSRPEERRAIFEDAVGINKYRQRKTEAEKKLIMAEQNLLRISDLKVEINEQKLSLEDQAMKAREYRKLQNQLKDIELGVFKRQLEALFKKKASLEERLNELKKIEDEWDQKEQGKIAQRQGLKNRLQEIESHIDEAHQGVEEKALERERVLFEEKNRLRDIKEEIRFLDFENNRTQEAIKRIAAETLQILDKIAQVTPPELEDYGALRDTVEEVLKLMRQMNGIAAGFGLREYFHAASHASEDRIIGMLKDEQSQKEIEAKDLQLSIEQKAERRASLLGKLNEMEKALTEARPEASAEAEKRLEELKTERTGLLEKMGNADEAGDRRQELSAREESSSLRISLVKADGEIAGILERSMNDYSLGCQEILACEIEISNLPKAKGEAESIKIRLRELEPVNLLAIEEYDRVKERCAFIEEQYADLFSAVKNLKDLIAELDQKAREDFTAGMEKISANFSEIFGQLFLGGEARIEIEKDKDLLLAGIDISVCPSGRKWLNLSLLSGGERALTAIAILFAILKTAPSPLCVLDEVDAPLDDSNVIRFADFLKNYSTATQILVITHNKQTMAVADSIYGVTMEEPGVSKVVSLKLEKV